MLTYNLFLEQLLNEDLGHYQDRVDERIRKVSDISFSEFALKNSPASFLDDNKQRIKEELVNHFLTNSKRFVQSMDVKSLNPDTIYIVKLGGTFTKQVDWICICSRMVAANDSSRIKVLTTTNQ